MSEIEIDRPVPDFERPATGDTAFRLADCRGRQVLLFFYPKANTPGCTQEGKDFRDLHDAFAAANTLVVGVSRDGPKAQQNFSDKYDFPFPLLSDKDEGVCTLFGVIKEKNMYGRRVMGVERSTFLIDADGVLRREWRGVKVKGHAEEALAAAKALHDGE
ncbi:Peroxiredoxin Bcp [wastewater metagenome]|uniref:thioredoxin-dependent peroxiredoxin n=2 Tax=unclassified sequences TaxID=12908 RepID=A0A5B8RE83_9ZZZZ|nr:peroxiredoxin [Arhodomonas sp. KWT]QEA07170.1 peroxiredoxin Bcp [uncultured organism]